jgi:hypothetical protein
MATKNKKAIAKEFRYDHPLSWFTDTQNDMVDQAFVSATIRWFESGPGSRALKPLDFLNLLFKQIAFLSEHITETEAVKEHFQNLPLTVTQRHILTGFIIKWWGGYPVRHAYRNKEATLRAIEELFLSGEPDSPEREFCKADASERKKLMNLGIALSAELNHGVDARELLNEIEEKDPEKYYKTFEELFQAAAMMEAVGPYANGTQFWAAKALHEAGFNNWLMDFKGWIYGDEEGYRKFLSRPIFMDYLRYNKKQQQAEKDQFASKKALWKLNDPQPATALDQQEPQSASHYENTVRNRLEAYEGYMQSAENYEYAVRTICTFLTDRQELKVEQVFVRSGIIKQFSKALGDIWKDNFNEVIPLSYVKMCQRLFSILAKYDIDEADYKGKPPYKYFISAT